MTRPRTFRILLVATLLCLSSSYALAEEEKDGDIPLVDRGENEDVFVFSSKIPESPALALAGLDVAKVTRVTEVRKFALSVPSSFDGDTRQAIALDLSPYEIFFEEKETFNTLSRYVEDDRRLARIARRTKLSLAIQGGKEDDEDADKSIKSLFAIGATTSLLDSSDPLYALGQPHQSTEYACKTLLDPAVAEFLQQDTYSERAGSIALTLRDINNDTRPLLNKYLEAESIPVEGHAEIARLIEQSILVHTIMLDYAQSDDALSPGDPGEKLPGPPARFDPARSKQSLVTFGETLSAMLKVADGPAYQENLKVPKSVTKLMTDCQSAIAHSIEMGAGLDVGAAMIWRGDPGGLGDFDKGAQALWLSARKGLWDSCARVKGADGKLTPHCDPAAAPRYLIAGLSARASFDETVSTGDDDLKESAADTWQAWGGLEFFSDKWRAAARYGYQDTDFNEPLAQSFSKSGELWQVDGDIRLNETLWIGLSYGKAAGTVDALDGEVFKLTLKFSEPKKLNVFAR